VSDRPYVESDPAAPQSNYARSKLLGEWFAADAPLHYVLRVESLFGGPLAKSSIDRILDAIQRGEPARVFVDRTVTPSYVTDVAEATAQLLVIRPPAGVYHCVNSGVTTWLEVALEAARLLGRDPNLIPTEVASVSLPAKRPKYCALSNEKLHREGIGMPNWQDALGRYIAGRS
jgi:dTDP-4-dehydrorhamnose reductase